MTYLAHVFWSIIEEQDFNTTMIRERRINEKIESLTSEIEELKQQKAELLN